MSGRPAWYRSRQLAAVWQVGGAAVLGAALFGLPGCGAGGSAETDAASSQQGASDPAPSADSQQASAPTAAPQLMRLEVPGTPSAGGELAVVADFDRNGLSDVALLPLGQANGRVALQREDASGLDVKALPAMLAAASAVAVDLDNDQDLDLLVVDARQPVGLKIFLNRLAQTGAVTFLEATNLGVPTQPFAQQVVAFDRDGDGDQDIVLLAYPGAPTSNSSQFPSMVLDNRLIQTGALSFVRRTGGIVANASPGGGNILGAKVLDANRDGRPDIYATREGADLLLIQRSDGNFADESQARGVTYWASERGIAVADIDVDGDDDIVAASSNGQVLLNINNGSGNFSTKTVGAAESFLPTGTLLMDVTGDNKLDIVVTSSHASLSNRTYKFTGITAGVPQYQRLTENLFPLPLPVGPPSAEAFEGQAAIALPAGVGSSGRSQLYVRRLLVDVTVSKNPVCEGEPFRIDVLTDAFGTPGDKIEVTVDGVTGSSRYLSLFGAFRHTLVVRATQGKLSLSRRVFVDVIKCATKYPKIIAEPSIFQPDTVEFDVVNESLLTGANRTFTWTFGDGTTAQTPYPFTTHSYADKLDPNVVKHNFVVSLLVKRDGQPDVTSQKTIVLHNHYAKTKALGYVHLPTNTSGPLIRDGKRLSATYRIRNPETTAVTLTEQRLQKHFCDATRDPELLPAETLQLTLGPKAEVQRDINLSFQDFGRDVCGVSVHLRSQVGAVRVDAEAYFESRSGLALEGELTDAASLALINGLAANGTLGNPNHTDGEELERLSRQRRIAAPPNTSQIVYQPRVYNADVGAPVVPGQPCDPEEDPPQPGLSCQVTDKWKVTPPLIRNALKGDLLIVAACEEIGDLLRSVVPPQVYTHEGVMTKNYYNLSHSTLGKDTVLATVDDSDPTGDVIDEGPLRYGWPGALHESIDTAFNELKLPDPKNVLRALHSFRPNGVWCIGDREIAAPQVVRPPLGSDVAVRTRLHGVADFAATDATHYRLFGFSHANIAFDAANNFSGLNYRNPTNGQPATVSTTFLWRALKSKGVTLEGATTEAGDNLELPRNEAGFVDGLYLYTKEERLRAAMDLYDRTVAKVLDLQTDGVGIPSDWNLDAFNGQSDRIAAQYVGCFANDSCNGSGFPASVDARLILKLALQASITASAAVSPDQFLNWDSPATGGNYGDSERIVYRSADYQRIYEWKPSQGSGTVQVHVVRPVDAAGNPVADCTQVACSPVEAAQVILGGRDGGTNAFGDFTFVGVDQGDYQIVAQKTICLSNCQSGTPVLEFFRAAQLIQVQQNVTTPVLLVLAGDDLIPPDQDFFARKVELEANLYILDDDDPDDDDDDDFALATSCEVSPLQREAIVSLGQSCVDDEVGVSVTFYCHLRPDNETVDVIAEQKIYEDTECPNDEEEGSIAGVVEVVAGAGVPPGLLNLTQTSLSWQVDADDPSFGKLTMTRVENKKGKKLVLPPVEPHNRRLVKVQGEVTIVDDDWPDSDDTKLLNFYEECYVDPLDPTDTISWEYCLDNEVRVEVHGECSLVQTNGKDEDPGTLDDLWTQHVNVRFDATLFEDNTCVTDDSDGTETREIAVAPCGSSCTPRDLKFVLKNEDEGGDEATFDLTVRNDQQL